MALHWGSLQIQRLRKASIGFGFLLASSTSFASWDGLRERYALYEYYQGNYFSALTQMQIVNELAERSRQETQGEQTSQAETASIPASAKLLEGGISLAFGLENKADTIFNSLLKSENEGEGSEKVTLKTRSTAWFYLGKLQYQQGDFEGAKASLAQVLGNLPLDKILELEYLQTNLSLYGNNIPMADSYARRIPQESVWRYYADYNIAAKKFEANEWEFGGKSGNLQALIDYFPDEETPELSDELSLLREKALIAQGYALLQQEKPILAMKYLGQVEQLHPRALLGYGWGAAQIENFPLALTPWLALDERGILDANGLEAVVAIPFAYERLDRPGKALSSYESAINKLLQEEKFIQAFESRVQGESLVDLLQLESSSGESLLTLKEHEQANEKWLSDPELVRVIHVLEREQVQRTLNDYRGLLRIKDYLVNWQKRLQAYEQLIIERKTARANKEQQIVQLKTEDKINELIQQRNALAQKLHVVENNGTGVEFLVGDDLEYWEMVVSALASARRLHDNGEDIIEYADALRRYKGMMLWQANENFVPQIRHHKKLLAEMDEAIDSLKQSHRQLSNSMKEKRDIVPYENRLGNLQARIQEQYSNIDSQLAGMEKKFKAVFLDELDIQKQRLNYYLSYARLGAARLYDKATDELAPVSRVIIPKNLNSESGE
ncbi:MAG: hypothetical protein K6L73_13705 [Cellvibrionaceae bacterium]